MQEEDEALIVEEEKLMLINQTMRDTIDAARLVLSFSLVQTLIMNTDRRLTLSLTRQIIEKKEH